MTSSLSERNYYKNRGDQGQDFDVGGPAIPSPRYVEGPFHPCPLEQEDWGEEQEGIARGGLSSHCDSSTLAHKRTNLGSE